MMQINIWFFVTSIVGALVFGAAGASVFIKQDAAYSNAPIVAQDCKPAQKETFRRGVKPNNTGLDKEF